MKSVVFYTYGDVGVLNIAQIPEPVPGPDEVLVRVRAAAVNPKDTFIRKGRFRDFFRCVRKPFFRDGAADSYPARHMGFHGPEARSLCRGRTNPERCRA